MQLFVFCCLLAVAVAGPQYYSRSPYYQQQQQPQYYQPQNYGKPNVPILAETNEVNADGSFRYGYSTGDGQQAQAQGYVKNAGYKDQEAEVVQGSYSYTSPDGTPISIRYVADENGFRAEGAHIPTPPPVPEPILRSLAYNAQNERVQYQEPQSQYNRQYQPQYRPYKPYRR